jgi:hypothetical protein
LFDAFSLAAFRYCTTHTKNDHMQEQFKQILEAFDYDQPHAVSHLHQIITINGKVFIGNSGQYLIDREHVEEVMKYCQQCLEHIDNEYVKSYNEALYKHRTREREMQAKKLRKEKRQQQGLTNIYLMLNKRNGLVKIGKAKDPQSRERTLQSEEPEIEMIFCIQAPPKIEIILHDRYSAQRVRGEWFKLSEKDIKQIKQALEVNYQ